MPAVSSSVNEENAREDGKFIGDRHIAVDMPSSAVPNAAPSRNERDDAFDRDMVTRAIADTGRWAFGTIAVEAWVLDNETGKLNRPEGAIWFDRALTAVESGKKREAILRLVDPDRPDYVSPEPLAPGIGLAGAIWSELARSNRGISGRGSVTPRTTGGIHLLAHRVVWRDVKAISVDPDQPYNLRLNVVAETGIGLVAGVPFDFRGVKGCVLYFARGTANELKLKSSTNTLYLLASADVIGSIIALRNPRQICLNERRSEREDVRRRLRLKMVAFIRIGGSFLREGGAKIQHSDDISTATSSSTLPDSFSSKSKEFVLKCWKVAKRNTIAIVRKCKGANNEPPPPMSAFESMWSFVGCFVSLLMLLNFSSAITKQNPALSLVTGPFGALMTLQYNLTAAPASQPRNAILGQTISLCVALGITYTGLDSTMRQALATALAIMLMARLGITHPPAGAAALIFSGGGYDWAHFGIMLAGNVLAIFLASIFNNANQKRQYPTFWGFGYWCHHFLGCNKAKSD